MRRIIAAGLGVLLPAALALPAGALAQPSYSAGQTIAPAYEGWEQNADGSFNLVFGYMNRNWEEVIDVPVGPGNRIEPGGPDQGQPTHFYPRRNRFVFRIRVPADFGDRELVWTLTTNGRTERAYATLKRDYYIDDLVIQANYGAGGGAGTTPELADNAAPTLAVEGGEARTVRAGAPLELVAVSTDDGRPRARSIRSSPRYPRPITTDTATGHRLSWFVYRGAGEVTFDPPQIKVWEDTRDNVDSPRRVLQAALLNELLRREYEAALLFPRYGFERGTHGAIAAGLDLHKGDGLAVPSYEIDFAPAAGEAALQHAIPPRFQEDGSCGFGGAATGTGAAGYVGGRVQHIADGSKRAPVDGAWAKLIELLEMLRRGVSLVP